MGHLLTFTGLMALLVGYLLGSIPFGLILTKAAGLGDLRQVGSGNIGATNVLRTGHKGLAAATLLLDALKGTIAVIIVYDVALWLGSSDAFAHNAIPDALAYSRIAGLGALLGHLFPVWLGFRGGKGVATFVGVLLGMSWLPAAWFGLIWLAVAAGTRYS
jgi:glycerol-3-phosphate acyltransferase PlsY